MSTTTDVLAAAAADRVSWDAFIASAPTVCESLGRLELAVIAGVDMQLLLALQAGRVTA